MDSCCAKVKGNVHPVPVRNRGVGKVGSGFWGERIGTSLWSSSFSNRQWKSLRKERKAKTINRAVLTPDVDQENLVSILCKHHAMINLICPSKLF